MEREVDMRIIKLEECQECDKQGDFTSEIYEF